MYRTSPVRRKSDYEDTDDCKGLYVTAADERTIRAPRYHFRLTFGQVQPSAVEVKEEGGRLTLPYTKREYAASNKNAVLPPMGRHHERAPFHAKIANNLCMSSSKLRDSSQGIARTFPMTMAYSTVGHIEPSGKERVVANSPWRSFDENATSLRKNAAYHQVDHIPRQCFEGNWVSMMCDR